MFRRRYFGLVASAFACAGFIGISTVACTDGRMTNGVSEETANLVVPLCANIHLAGSIAKIVVFSAGFLLLSGGTIGAGAFAEYILLLSVLAVAAPGVPGGMVLAAAPIAESALGLAPEHYAILMAAYLSIDGVGTACNLTGDGAIALVVDKFRRCNA